MIAGLLAAGLSGLWVLVHLFVGGREVATPLRQDTQLPEAVRVTMWMCWHMVTATLAVMAVLLAWGTLGARPDLTLAGGVLAPAVALAGIAAATLQSFGLKLLPQGSLFVPVAALAWVAL